MLQKPRMFHFKRIITYMYSVQIQLKNSLYFTKGTRTTNFCRPWTCSSTCNIVKWSNAQKIMFYTFFFNSNIIAAFSKSASHWIFDCLLSARKYNVFIMMKLVVIWQYVEKLTITCMQKFSVWKCRKMHQSMQTTNWIIWKNFNSWQNW